MVNKTALLILDVAGMIDEDELLELVDEVKVDDYIICSDLKIGKKLKTFHTVVNPLEDNFINIADFLVKNSINEIILCGSNADNELVDLAITLKNYMMKVIVLEPYCLSENGENIRDASIQILKNILGVERIINTLDDGSKLEDPAVNSFDEKINIDKIFKDYAERINSMPLSAMDLPKEEIKEDRGGIVLADKPSKKSNNEYPFVKGALNAAALMMYIYNMNPVSISGEELNKIDSVEGFSYVKDHYDDYNFKQIEVNNEFTTMMLEKVTKYLSASKEDEESQGRINTVVSSKLSTSEYAVEIKGTYDFRNKENDMYILYGLVRDGRLKGIIGFVKEQLVVIDDFREIDNRLSIAPETRSVNEVSDRGKGLDIILNNAIELLDSLTSVEYKWSLQLYSTTTNNVVARRSGYMSYMGVFIGRLSCEVSFDNNGYISYIVRDGISVMYDALD